MHTTKKWMVVLTDEQYDWVKGTAEKADVSGASVLRALISEAMEINSNEFRRSLQSAQLKTELLQLEEKKAQIAEKERELRLKLSGREKILA